MINLINYSSIFLSSFKLSSVMKNTEEIVIKREVWSKIIKDNLHVDISLDYFM